MTGRRATMRLRGGVAAGFALLGALAAAPRPACAQDAGAGAVVSSLSGQVMDASSGHPVAGAVIGIYGTDTVMVRTSTGGGWRTGALRAGVYEVRVRAMGFQPRAHRVAVAETPSGAVGAAALITRLDAVALSLDEIVVTAARREQRLADVVTTTELVTREQIARTGASDLAGVLLEQAGIELQGGHPAGTGVMLQGLGSERVLVLLDGQPVAGRISGVFDASRIPTSMIERVEVVKGPQSTLYGTDAMGGVVNVITRTPVRDVLGSTLTATAGSQARRDGSASVMFGFGDLAASFDVSSRSSETTPGRAAAEGALARRLDGGGKVRWTPDSTRWIEASVLALDERQRWRSGTFYNFGDNSQWSGRVAGSWTRGRHRLAPTASASVFDHLSRGSTETRPIAGDPGDRQLQRVYQGEVLYNGRFGTDGAQGLDAGVQLRRDEMETARVPGGLRTVTSLDPFAQIEVVPSPRLSLMPGVRLSHSSQWGSHLTPRVAARVRATPQLTLRSSVGEGYRAPDFKELYMFFQNTNAGYAVQGNPALRPETSRNATAGAEWVGARTYLRGQLFWNEFRDFIETRPITAPGEPPVYEFRNVDDGYTRGAELEAGLALRGLRLEGGYNLLDTRDHATGRPLLGRPMHAARATGGMRLPGALRTSVTVLHTGRTPMQRDAATGAITSWRDAFLRLDARAARALGGSFRGVELVIGADNLFDMRPAEWAGFTGRHLYTALTWTFNTTSRTDIP